MTLFQPKQHVRKTLNFVQRHHRHRLTTDFSDELECRSDAGGIELYAIETRQWFVPTPDLFRRLELAVPEQRGIFFPGLVILGKRWCLIFSVAQVKPRGREFGPLPLEPRKGLVRRFFGSFSGIPAPCLVGDFAFILSEL